VQNAVSDKPSADVRSAEAGDGGPPAASGRPDRQAALRQVLRRFLRSRGPVTLDQVRQRYALPEKALKAALDELVRQGDAVYGKLSAEAEQPQWCDRRNLEKLYRRAVARRRDLNAPVDLSTYLKFLLLYHGIDPLRRPAVAAGLHPVMQRYRGLSFPVGHFEREILINRLSSPDGVSRVVSQAEELLRDWSRQGRLVWMAEKNGAGCGSVRFFWRGEGRVFLEEDDAQEGSRSLSPDARVVYDLLLALGASFAPDLEVASGMSAVRVRKALGELLAAGLVTNDEWPTTLRLAELWSATWQPPPGMAEDLREELPRWAVQRPSWRRRRRGGRSLRERQRAAAGGRWSLLRSPAVLGPELQASERARRQALLLIERHGILAREHHRREQGWLPWGQLFRELKRLEWRAEIRRGYFVEGLSGVQFATAEAVALLRRVANGEEQVTNEPVMLSAVDPAVPYGGGVGFGLQTAGGRPISFVRHYSNYLILQAGTPIVYVEGYGARLWPLGHLSEEVLARGLRMLHRFLQLPPPLRPRRKVEVLTWDEEPAGRTAVADLLSSLGFEREGERMVLWPSRALTE